MNEQDINEFIKQVGRKAGIDELINNDKIYSVNPVSRIEAVTLKMICFLL